MRNAKSSPRHLGFSLVELVTTILLIGILAVVVLPRFFSDSSYSAFALRNEFISELRQAQLRALNNSDRCYDINVTANNYQLRHYSGRSGSSCNGLIRSETLQPFPSGAHIELTASNSQTFTITFDNLGRLLTPSCSGNCFTVVANDELSIAVESQGYVYAN